MISKLIFTEGIDEIDTFQSYFGKIIFKEDGILVPYINLGISNHRINPTQILMYVDFCYFVSEKISYLKINNRIIKNDLKINYDSTKSIYLGGNDLLENQNIYDIEVQSQNSFLQLLETSLVSYDQWAPVVTPNFETNMSFEKVNDFISNKNLPVNLSIFEQKD